MLTVLTVVGLVAVLLVLVLLFGFTVHQMMTCPFWLIYHVCCGTLNGLGSLIGAVFEAIGEQLTGSGS